MSSIGVSKQPLITTYATAAGASIPNLGLSSAVVLFVVLLVVLIVGIVFGNTLVMLAYWKFREVHRDATNLIIFHLSIADILTGVYALPMGIVFLVGEDRGRSFLSKFGCNLSLAVGFLLTTVQTSLIIFILLQRFVLVYEPRVLVGRMRRKHIKIGLVIIWCYHVGLYSFTFFIWPTTKPVSYGYVDYAVQCYPEYLYDFTMTSVMMAVEFLIPLATIALLTIVIYVGIRKRSLSVGVIRKPQRNEGEQNVPVVKGTSGSPIEPGSSEEENTGMELKTAPGHQRSPGGNAVASTTTGIHGSQPRSSANKVIAWNVHAAASAVTAGSADAVEVQEVSKRPAYHLHTLKKHRKAFFTLLTLVLAFVICWVPPYACAFALLVCPNCNGSQWASYFAVTFYINSLINPIVYAARSVCFRRAFSRMLRRPCTD